MSAGLASLPVELLLHVQQFALSESFPCICRHIYQVFQQSPISFRARYLQARAVEISQLEGSGSTLCLSFSHILRYPLCTQEVLTAIFRNPTQHFLDDVTEAVAPPELPKRLFRSLSNSRASNIWKKSDSPLPFLRFLYESPLISQRPDINSHKGYALTKAVYAGFDQLVRFLLEYGASPSLSEYLAIKVAIRKKDLKMTRLLIEPSVPYSARKRRRLADRINVTPDLLRVATKVKAWDIVDYFMNEKDCVPDMVALQLMMSRE